MNLNKINLKHIYRVFCMVWIFTVFFIDWILHEMPCLNTPPHFLTKLFDFLTALFSGTYAP